MKMTNIPIFLASDDNYAPFVATTIASICDNTKSFIDFYVLSDGITSENQNIIRLMQKDFPNFSVEFLQIDAQNLFKDFTTAKSITLSTYNRFLIPQLKPNLGKVLYSDVDVIVLGDIAEMYNENLNGHILGAIWEEYAEKNDNIKRRNALGLSQEHKYFSAGNLLIDCEKWRAENITEKLFEFEKNYRDRLLYADQDVMNICFDNNYQPLPKRYCYIFQDFFFYKEHNDILIRHYNGPIKPWRISPDIKTSLIPNIDDFWFYARKTPYYEKIYQKTQNKTEQDMLLRQLRIEHLFTKSKSVK